MSDHPSHNVSSIPRTNSTTACHEKSTTPRKPHSPLLPPLAHVKEKNEPHASQSLKYNSEELIVGTALEMGMSPSDAMLGLQEMGMHMVAASAESAEMNPQQGSNSQEMIQHHTSSSTTGATPADVDRYATTAPTTLFPPSYMTPEQQQQFMTHPPFFMHPQFPIYGQSGIPQFYSYPHCASAQGPYVMAQPGVSPYQAMMPPFQLQPQHHPQLPTPTSDSKHVHNATLSESTSSGAVNSSTNATLKEEDKPSTSIRHPGSSALVSLSSSLASLAEAAASVEETSKSNYSASSMMELLKKNLSAQNSETSDNSQAQAQAQPARMEDKSNALPRSNSFSTVRVGDGGMTRGMSAVMEMGGFGLNDLPSLSDSGSSSKSFPAKTGRTSNTLSSSNLMSENPAVWGGVDGFPSANSDSTANLRDEKCTANSQSSDALQKVPVPVDPFSGAIPLSMMTPATMNGFVAAPQAHPHMIQPYYIVPTLAADGSMMSQAYPGSFQPPPHMYAGMIPPQPFVTHPMISPAQDPRQNHQQDSSNRHESSSKDDLEKKPSELEQQQQPQQQQQQHAIMGAPHGYPFDPRLYSSLYNTAGVSAASQNASQGSGYPSQQQETQPPGSMWLSAPSSGHDTGAQSLNASSATLSQQQQQQQQPQQHMAPGYYFALPQAPHPMHMFQPMPMTMPMHANPAAAAGTLATTATSASSTSKRTPAHNPKKKTNSNSLSNKTSPKRKRSDSHDADDDEQNGEGKNQTDGSGASSSSANMAAAAAAGMVLASVPIPMVDATGRIVYMESTANGGMTPWTGMVGRNTQGVGSWAGMGVGVGGMSGSSGGRAIDEEYAEDETDASRKNLVPRRYLCSLCSKRFTRPSTLRTHMNSHTGERPFVCTAAGCGWKFTVLSNLKRHLKICPSVQQQNGTAPATAAADAASGGAGTASVAAVQY
ncbi:hypothetical protein CcCBS67573_g06154 [Chytriomyces confervae]|uniref:C2H2-type domain-containing protein n=1 Tax=Chytriomyces confervae TaxID=246404 RepID=A0A507F7I4_9FUNG|nr:hypothetical protein HDU80_004061 [Chytriomyces hyalinus]TPX71590.1 hypothetical protein CcCBS67573_g06154 [Chytriomyces confervae]